MQNRKYIIIAILLLFSFPNISNAQSRKDAQIPAKPKDTQRFFNDTTYQVYIQRKQKSDSIGRINLHRLTHPVQGAKLKIDTIFAPGKIQMD